MANEIEDAFHRRMVELCDSAERECAGFRPDCLRSLIEEHGGRGAAARLVDEEHAPGGFVRLWELGRLDLSVEAEILRPGWEPLFDDAQRARASERLARYGHPAPADAA